MLKKQRVKITIINSPKKIPINPRRIKKAILKVLSSEGLRKSGEITICFVGDEKIKGFNKKYRGQNYPTDVLAFDTSGPIDRGRIFADIMVSVDTAIRNAEIFKTTPLYELYLYVIHGFLHLL